MSSWDLPAADHESRHGKVTEKTAGMKEASAERKCSSAHIIHREFPLSESSPTQETGCEAQAHWFLNASLSVIPIPYSALAFQSSYQYVTFID